MSYDLHARNKNIESIRFGVFSWPIMLQDTGMGYILNYGAGKDPASYVYGKGNNGSPASNDGYRVTSEQAKAMATVARGYVFVKSFINKEWDKIPEPQRQQDIDFAFDGRKIHLPPVNQEFLDSLLKFAEFAEKSHGFIIT